MQSEYEALELNFNSDPSRYLITQPNLRISYAASFFTGPGMEWFRPHIDETNSNIDFDPWKEFVQAVIAAFDNSDTGATAEHMSCTL